MQNEIVVTTIEQQAELIPAQRNGSNHEVSISRQVERKPNMSSIIMANMMTIEKMRFENAQHQVAEGASWRAFAACRNEDPETFFPVAQNQNAAREAGEICARCPVAMLCLAEAIDYKERPEEGVWAGTTKRQRNRMVEKYQARTLLGPDEARSQLAGLIRAKYYSSIEQTYGITQKSA